MRFFMPTELLEEENCVEKYSEKLSALGTNAFIVTGKNSARKCGAFDDVINALDKLGIGWSEFAEVEENPSVETVMKARDLAIEKKADFVIGIGGGSPLDAAKAIALMAAHPEAGADSLYGGELDAKTLPLAAVPTTCGTGSEATGVAVLTRHDKKTKGSIPYRIFPKVSFIDGKYLIDAPMSLIIHTAVDALAHIVESMFMKKADDYSRMAALQGLRVWVKSKPVLMGLRPLRMEDRRNLMCAASLAGIAIAQTGTSIPHALSYPLTYDLGIPHGKAVGYFLGSFLEAAPEEERWELLTAGGFRNVKEFKDFLTKVLGETEVTQETLDRGYDMVKDDPKRMECNIFEVTHEDLRRIIYEK
ncbi:MAG: iron-containing alcohol dehydrogenase [Lachnospiraceae bacterium]|nr:iron-containing alcohol dehydrogenase [Lachnospiraceae bacterium]